jgi:8-oxo-dGTP diphosphatase
VSKSVIEVVAAVIEDEGRYLLVQRMPHAVLPLLWEFPGGRVEMEETPEDALRREVEWRIGVKVEILDRLGEHVHEYEHYDVHMGMYACRLPEGSHPKAVNVNDLVWAPSDKLGDYQFPPADEGTMDKLLGLRRE